MSLGLTRIVEYSTPTKTARADAEFDVKYVTDLVAQARKQLSSFAFAKSSRESEYYFQAMGRNEGLYTSIQLVMLDKDGNGENR